MIEQEFDSSDIKTIQFGVSLFTGEKYLVPVDKSIDPIFNDMLARTIGSINVRSEEWAEYSLSQDYGKVERVYALRSDTLFGDLSKLYEVDGLTDMANLLDNIEHVDFYFTIYHDRDNRKVIGVRRAAALKSTLTARNRLVQLYDNTLVLIKNPVFKLDVDFDGLIPIVMCFSQTS